MCYIPHLSEPSSFHYASNFSLWWSVNITELFKNLCLLIPFLTSVYSFLYFMLKIHYHKQKFTPKPRKTLGRHFDAILIPNVNTRAAACGSHDLSGLLICCERATSAIWCVSCKLWRHGATHTLVPTDATSCKSPFAIRKASVCRRSMDWRFEVFVFVSEISFKSIIAKFGTSERIRECYTTTKGFWNISHNAYSLHSRNFSAFITVGLHLYGSSVASFFFLCQGARNHQLPT